MDFKEFVNIYVIILDFCSWHFYFWWIL